MTTRLMLVRHGATTLTSSSPADDRFAGSTDAPLSETGRLQARQLGERLAREPLAAVYASPMRRAIETAQLAARPHDLHVSALGGLREIDHGRWEGLTRFEVEAQYPDEYAAWVANPFDAAPLGGETGATVLLRARAALDAIVLAHPGQEVLVVSHKATIRLLVATLLGFDPHGYRDRLDQQPGCLNVIDVAADGTGCLMLFNDISHYAAEPRSIGAAVHRRA